MRKRYEETTFGKLKDGDCFWKDEEDCGYRVIQRQKYWSCTQMYLVDYADGRLPEEPLRTPEDHEPVWIEKHAGWWFYVQIAWITLMVIFAVYFGFLIVQYFMEK